MFYDSLAELTAAFEGKTVRGEVTVVIAGSNPKFAFDEADQAEGDSIAPDESEG